MRLAALLTLLAAPAALVAQTSGMLRYPDIHGDRVVFAYAGDLWLAPSAGGDALRLTTHSGYEYLPKFSPDGRWIAFSAEYEGNLDVYVMPSRGGEPQRLTFHPLADRVAGWTRDGRIVFRSKRTSIVQIFDKLFVIGTSGGWPEELPVPSSGPMSFSPDGEKIAYNRVSGESRFWKRYRGGTQSFVSISDLKSGAYDEIPHTDASDHFPMWLGNAILFLSDREGTANLYRWDLADRQLRRVTSFDEYDVKWPSLAADGSAIVFENGGVLYRFDPKTERAAAIPLRVVSENLVARSRTVNVPDRLINSFSLSPSGVRALIGGRGEIFTVPAKDGETRNITNSSGARELWPAWSPDGRMIAYASDETGEYEIYVRRQEGGGEARRLTNAGPGFRSGLQWSPDSKKVLYSDSSLALFHVDANGGAPVLLDRAEYGPIRTYDWSPDAQWIVYARPEANRLGRLFLYSVAQKRSFPLTDGKTDDTSPVFDRNGRYLYFLSRRTFSPRFSDFEKTFNFNQSTGIYVVTLRSELASPFAPRSDEEPAAETVPPSDGPFRIDLAGIERRIVAVPVDAADYSGLRAAENRVFYLTERSGASGPNKTLKSYDVAARAEETIIENIGAYELSRSGEKVIYRAGAKFGVIGTKGTSKVGDGALNVAALAMSLDPRAEWRQIFLEAWRMQRDFFYDPTMRGVDWQKVKERYEKELPFVGLRSDLNYLIGEMNGELEISHMNASGGDGPEIPRTAAGLLGADLAIANGRYRFRRIYRGDNSLPDARAPLAEPGVDVREGDYLLAINGKPIVAGEEIFARFDRTAGKQVRLLIHDKPSVEGARLVTVVPVESEAELRYLDWVESNARRVDRDTAGRCAYIHLPDTGDAGIAAFARAFYAQTYKRCLLLDARYNSGGYIPDFLFERLSRRHLEYDAPRYGADLDVQLRIDGPKVLVINEYAGSGGDSVADYFRKYALGPIVGKRTWGGVVGIGDELPMIDGGRVNVAEVAAWDVVDGRSVWIIENRGVPPDIDVDNRPDLLLQGRDPQLERGIAVLIEALKDQPPLPKRPPYGKPQVP